MQRSVNGLQEIQQALSVIKADQRTVRPRAEMASLQAVPDEIHRSEQEICKVPLRLHPATERCEGAENSDICA